MVLLGLLGPATEDLSVEPPWRHVRRLAVGGIDRVEQTVTLRDDGPTSHAAWCVGLAAEPDDPAADRALAELAQAGEQLLDRLETGTRG
jgi:hypothetical protein